MTTDLKKLSEAQAEAALIIRTHKPTTLGSIEDIARGRLVAGSVENLAGASACENAHAEMVSSAHYRSLRNPEYRAAANMTPLPQPPEGEQG